MLRRQLLKNVGLTAALLSLPKFAQASAPPAYRPGLTIGQIITVVWPAVVADMCGHNSWASRELRHAARVGRLSIQSLAPYVRVGAKDYRISEIMIPMLWTPEDERRANTEAKKITFTTRLVENAINSHDDFVFDNLGNGEAVASREYRYSLSEVCQSGPWEQQRYFVARLYTAIAFINPQYEV